LGANYAVARKKTTALPAVYSLSRETDATLRAYKEKFLKQPSFVSDTGVRSQVIFAYLLLALERLEDAEAVADCVIAGVDVPSSSSYIWEAAWRAARLSAWLKARRRADTSEPLAVAAKVSHMVDRWDKREMRRWLVEDADTKIAEARSEDKSRSAYLTIYHAFGPLVKELHERVSGVSREKVEALYEDALTILRSIAP
jgi:hypothetical protein